MKKVKLVSFTLICTIIIQIFMPILMDIDWNAVFAENSGNIWDISENEDGSVIAELSDDGTLTISGSGEMKDWNFFEKTDWHTDKNKVKEIIIKKGVTSIGNYAFWDCSSVTNITIPEGVTSIGVYAFAGCSSVTSITIPEGVTSIGVYAFYGCSSVTSITIPEGVTSIGDSAFSKCSNLASITIPEGVTSIGNYAFSNCSSLANITISEGVTSIGEHAFAGCSSLTNITIPEGVTSIGGYAFAGCSNLTSIGVSENNKNYLSVEGVLYTKDKTQIVNYPEGKQNAEYTILKGVTSIGDSAFWGCNSLASIIIPEGVTSIGDSAFSNCSNLASITIPEGVTSIGGYAFYSCSSLTNIAIPEGVTSIGDSAFGRCSSLANITIPKGVTSIGDYAFSSCSSLTNITIPEGVTSIGDSAFLGCSSLTNIIIPEGVTSIGDSAFSICSNLASITIPEGVTNIGENVFMWSYKLKIYCKSNAYAKKYAEENKISYSIDDEAPTITSVTGNETWQKEIKLTINAEDNQSGLAYKAYSFDNGQTWQKENTKIYTENTNGIIIKVKDALGNEVTQEVGTIKIDNQAPIIKCVEGNATEWTKNNVTLKIIAEDNQSGLANEAYSFDNGQTWQKENTKTYTENTNGIIIKVKDALGNITTYDSINIDKILKINITDYEEITKENKKYITKITQNTTIQQLKEKIETNGTVKIYKGDNEITGEETLVGTGMTMQIGNENYVLVVRGDINGDGKISLVDLANLKLSVVGKRTLNTASAIAGDINGDGNTSLNDLVKLKMYLVGKIII